MNSTREAFDDAKFVVDGLGKWCKAVGGARGVGNGGVFGVIFIEVDTANEHGRIWPWRGGDDLICTALQVSRSPIGDMIHVVRSRCNHTLFSGGENTLVWDRRSAQRLYATAYRGFDNAGGSDFTPFDVCRITLSKDGDGLSVDDELAILGKDLPTEVVAVIVAVIVTIVGTRERDGNGEGVLLSSSRVEERAGGREGASPRRCRWEEEGRVTARPFVARWEGEGEGDAS